MLQLKYGRGEYYTTLLKFLPCKYQSSLHYFPMSNGVNKLELGYDSWFYGLWHIIFLWAGEWTCQSCVMTSLHPKQQHALPGFECHSLVKSAVSTPAFYRWGDWGRAERWDQPRSPKRRARVMMCPSAPWDPSLTLSAWGSSLVHPVKTQKVVPVTLDSSETGAPRTRWRAELLRAVQTTYFVKQQGLLDVA